MNGFDFSELESFDTKLVNVAQDKFTNKTKKFMNKEGVKLKKVTLKKAKDRVKKGTGNLFKGIKKGKVYRYSGNDGIAVRVYGAAPHTHLVENGHRIVDKNGNELGFVEGRYFFKDSAKEYEQTFFEDTENFLDEIVEEVVKD